MKSALVGPSIWFAALVMATAIGVVYGPAINAPLFFDDRATIDENASVTSLWPLVGTTAHPGPLNPPHDSPMTSRPLVNLSFAVNYHFNRLEPAGYHAVSFVIHFAAALLLWAVVRRTLLRPYFVGRFDTSAGWLALAAAILWALHPLATEAVIYATQRTEQMMALFYLATLYCSLRYWSVLAIAAGAGVLERSTSGREQGEGVVATHSRRARTAWLILAIIACLCGMASKEVMVSAPLIVLLFDRAFVSGSLANAIRRSWPLYAGLFATWIPLLLLHFSGEPSSTAGFGLGVSAYAWWLIQCKIFLMYLKLAIWPAPLQIHYELPYFDSFAQAWPYVVPVLLLGVLTLVLLWRNKPAGFLLTVIFAVLSPTFLIPITSEMAAERRMYLPLAALLVLLVVGVYQLLDWALRRYAPDRQTKFGLRSPPAIIALPLILITLVCGAISAKRAAAFYDEMQLWRDVLQYQPHNYMAHSSLGNALRRAGQMPEAIVELQLALAQRPRYFHAHNGLGVALIRAGRIPEAIEELQTALELKPDFASSHLNIGMALARQGRYSDAVEHLEQALKLRPSHALTHNNLGLALASLDKVPEAIDHLQQSLELGHDDFALRVKLGQLLVRSGKFNEGIVQLERADEMKPDRADIQDFLGEAYRKSGRYPEAIEHCQAAIRLDPNYLQAYADLALALAATNRFTEAVAVTEQAVEAATKTGQKTAVEQFQQLLDRLRADLERSNGAAAQPQSSPAR